MEITALFLEGHVSSFIIWLEQYLVNEDAAEMHTALSLWINVSVGISEKTWWDYSASGLSDGQGHSRIYPLYADKITVEMIFVSAL